MSKNIEQRFAEFRGYMMACFDLHKHCQQDVKTVLLEHYQALENTLLLKKEVRQAREEDGNNATTK